MKIYHTFFFLFIAVSTIAQTKISTNDFKLAFGKWEGSLTYLDYQTAKPYTMAANIAIEPNASNNNTIILRYKYPKEPQANGNDTLVINNEGTMLDKAKVVARKIQVDGTLQIVIEENGFDGNDRKAAILRHTYTIGKKVFSIQKDVQFVGTTEWLKRNVYAFSR